MNALCNSEVSSYYKHINNATFFYSIPHDAETLFRKGQNALHMMAQIGQYCTKKLCGGNDETLYATAKEYEPTKHETRNEKIKVLTTKK